MILRTPSFYIPSTTYSYSLTIPLIPIVLHRTKSWILVSEVLPRLLEPTSDNPTFIQQSQVHAFADWNHDSCLLPSYKLSTCLSSKERVSLFNSPTILGLGNYNIPDRDLVDQPGVGLSFDSLVCLESYDLHWLRKSL